MSLDDKSNPTGDGFVPFSLSAKHGQPVATVKEDRGNPFASFSSPGEKSGGMPETALTAGQEQELSGDVDDGHTVTLERVDGRVEQIRVKCSCGKVMLLDCRYPEEAKE